MRLAGFASRATSISLRVFLLARKVEGASQCFLGYQSSPHRLLAIV